MLLEESLNVLGHFLSACLVCGQFFVVVHVVPVVVVEDVVEGGLGVLVRVVEALRELMFGEVFEIGDDSPFVCGFL